MHKHRHDNFSLNIIPIKGLAPPMGMSPTPTFLITEDGNFIITEDGDFMIAE